jgi:hypothetical protein
MFEGVKAALEPRLVIANLEKKNQCVIFAGSLVFYHKFFNVCNQVRRLGGVTARTVSGAARAAARRWIRGFASI